MHLLFVDESGKPSDPTFGVGGAVIAASDWPIVQERWSKVLEDHGWPHDKELKWHGTRTGEVPPDLADAVFEVLAGAPISCYAILLKPIAGKRHEELGRFFTDDEETYATGLTFIAERFQRFLVREDSHGLIVLDSRRHEDDQRTRRFFATLRREGTPFLELDRIVDSIMLGPSDMSLGLQVADLVIASALAARHAPGDASRWHKELLPRFARHPDTGAIEGVGLVEFPGQVGKEREPAKLFE